MSEKVEQVARALWDAEFDREITSPWDAQTHLQKSFYHMLARAAIEAMREPTGAMLTAGRVNLGGTDELHIDEAEEAWRKMIDAALKG